MIIQIVDREVWLRKVLAEQKRMNSIYDPNKCDDWYSNKRNLEDLSIALKSVGTGEITIDHKMLCLLEEGSPCYK